MRFFGKFDGLWQIVHVESVEQSQSSYRARILRVSRDCLFVSARGIGKTPLAFINGCATAESHHVCLCGPNTVFQILNALRIGSLRVDGKHPEATQRFGSSAKLIGGLKSSLERSPGCILITHHVACHSQVKLNFWLGGEKPGAFLK